MTRKIIAVAFFLFFVVYLGCKSPSSPIAENAKIDGNGEISTVDSENLVYQKNFKMGKYYYDSNNDGDLADEEATITFTDSAIKIRTEDGTKIFTNESLVSYSLCSPNLYLIFKDDDNNYHHFGISDFADTEFIKLDFHIKGENDSFVAFYHATELELIGTATEPINNNVLPFPSFIGTGTYTDSSGYHTLVISESKIYFPGTKGNSFEVEKEEDVFFHIYFDAFSIERYNIDFVKENIEHYLIFTPTEDGDFIFQYETFNKDTKEQEFVVDSCIFKK